MKIRSMILKTVTFLAAVFFALRTMKPLIYVSIIVGLLAGLVQASVIFSVDYESLSTGNLSGQDGWHTIYNYSSTVTNVNPTAGAQSLINISGGNSGVAKAMGYTVDPQTMTGPIYLSALLKWNGVDSGATLTLGMSEGGNSNKFEVRFACASTIYAYIRGPGYTASINHGGITTDTLYMVVAKIEENTGDPTKLDFKGKFFDVSGGTLGAEDFTGSWALTFNRTELNNSGYLYQPDEFFVGINTAGLTADNAAVSTTWADIQLFLENSQFVGAHTPDPEDEDANVEIDAVLSWSAAHNNPAPTGYDVYLGTNSDFSGQSPVSTNQPGLIFDPFGPADLDIETTYYWRIDAYRPDQTKKTGDVWSFSTIDNPCNNIPPVIDGPHTVDSAARKPTLISVTVQDDGKPYTGGCDIDYPDVGTSYSPVYQWTQQSGPATAVFSPPSANVKNISVMFPVKGTYELLFEASDGPVSPGPLEGKTSQWSVTIEVIESLDGDVDINWSIGLNDLMLLAQQWLDAPACISGDDYCADFDNSGDIDAADFTMLSANWNRIFSPIVLSEFMSSNDTGIKDNYGSRPDWIEIANVSSQAVNMEGYRLTDEPGTLNKWVFPSVVLDAGDYLIVYASGRNETDPESPLHTNFKLDSEGEYLALAAPDGTIVTELSPAYPIQVTDISYGLTDGAFTSTDVLVGPSAQADILVPTDDSLDDGSWTQSAFDSTGWIHGGLGAGYDTGTNYDSLISTNLQSQMYNGGFSAYIRIPFEIADPTDINELILRMKYDDAFAAYINGVPVARSESVNSSDDFLAWDHDCGDHPDSQAIVFEDHQIDLSSGLLHVGTNMLAVHGLNDGPSSDALFLPELHATTISGTGTSSEQWGYFIDGTPDEINTGALETLGAVIRQATESLPCPADNEDIIITATVEETLAPVDNVKVYYCVMYGSESELIMLDDGSGNDVVAGDGIYTATIPSSAGTPGQMVRWRFVTEDDNVTQFKLPTYLNPDRAPQYFGTVIADPDLDNIQPVFQWFTENYSAATTSGYRGSGFYKDHFYDNVRVKNRGQTTRVSRAGKRSLNFDFNPGNGFYYNEEIPGAGEINLNNNMNDKSFMVWALASRAFKLAGHGYPHSEPIATWCNGNFEAIRIFIEQPEDEYLERHELDPMGALYKALQSPQNPMIDGAYTSGYSKHTREWESFSDIVEFVNGIKPYHVYDITTPANSVIKPIAERRQYVYDHGDIAALINYTASIIIIYGNDHVHKNYWFYCDTEGTGQWQFLPWDMDMSNGVIVNERFPDNHPLLGCEAYPRFDNPVIWNGLIDLIMMTPELRQMHLRRLRTLMDEILQEPYPAYDEYKAFMDDYKLWMLRDVGSQDLQDLERSKWPADYTYSHESVPADIDLPTLAIDHKKANYLNQRREHLFNFHELGSYSDSRERLTDYFGIPNAQSAGLTIDFGTIEVSPANGNQDQEYIQLINNNSVAVDISNWTLIGGIDHTFTPGTVIPTGYSLYVSPNVKAFLARATSPRGGQNLFAQGNYKGHLSSWGETIELRDDGGGLNNTISTPSSPSDTQQYLRITEIMYHPATGGSYNEEEYEFIELKNTDSLPLLLDGVKLTNGVEYEFPTGTTLSGGQYTLLVKNQSAFESRYGTGHPIAGQYTGSLSNSGEQIALDDPIKGSILKFSYNDTWYPVTDGQGFSLTIINENDPVLDNWDIGSAWRPSGQVGGSPAAVDIAVVPAPGAIVINELLAHSDFAPNDWIELHNTTEAQINVGGWYLSDNDANLLMYEIPLGTIINPNGYVVFTQDDHFGGQMAYSENGETAYLSSAQDGILTGYSETQSFGASEGGVAFGRYIKSSGDVDFVAMAGNTPGDIFQGDVNGGPKVPAVVITEIMYNPVDPNDGRDNDLFEYIELYNRTGSPVSLETYDNVLSDYVPWAFTKGIDYTFPSGVTIPGGSRILVVKDITAFQERYPLVPSGIIYGPYEGQLSNGGEKLELSMPGDEVLGQRQYIRLEQVNYSDGSHPIDTDPWPTSPDGTGNSLKRIENDQYSNDVNNWQGSAASPNS